MFTPRNPNNGKGSKFNLPRIPLKGLFGKGGGKGKGQGNRPSYGAPKPSYGAPKPSYGAPAAPQGPPRPNYGGAPAAPQGPPRPNYGGNNGGGHNGGGSSQFGPSNAIKMLPAPNLATGRPPVSDFCPKNFTERVKLIFGKSHKFLGQ